MPNLGKKCTPGMFVSYFDSVREILYDKPTEYDWRRLCVIAASIVEMGGNPGPIIDYAAEHIARNREGWRAVSDLVFSTYHGVDYPVGKLVLATAPDGYIVSLFPNYNGRRTPATCICPLAERWVLLETDKAVAEFGNRRCTVRDLHYAASHGHKQAGEVFFKLQGMRHTDTDPRPWPLAY